MMLATAAQAETSKLSCEMTQSCTAQGKCGALAKPVVIGFCDEGSRILVATKGGKTTHLKRIKDEEAYAKRPYKVMKGKRIDVGQWVDLDAKVGAPNLITFVMHEASPTAALFRGDPLKQRGLGYLFGSCTQQTVNRCKANK